MSFAKLESASLKCQIGYFRSLIAQFPFKTDKVYLKLKIELWTLKYESCSETSLFAFLVHLVWHDAPFNSKKRTFVEILTQEPIKNNEWPGDDIFLKSDLNFYY
jgi:hypothetical protein